MAVEKVQTDYQKKTISENQETISKQKVEIDELNK